MEQTKKALEIIQQEFKEKFGVEVNIELKCYSIEPVLSKEIVNQFGPNELIWSATNKPTSWHNYYDSGWRKNCGNVSVTCFHNKFITKDVEEECEKETLSEALSMSNTKNAESYQVGMTLPSI